MLKNQEIFGLRVELVGLLLVLVATVWQGAFTDWFDKTSRDWIAYTQEEVNVALLLAVNELSLQVIEDDAAKRQKVANQINERTSLAVSKAIDERQRRQVLERGQGAMFSRIRYILLVLGAVLVVLGKWLVLQHKKSVVASSSSVAGAP